MVAQIRLHINTQHLFNKLKTWLLAKCLAAKLFMYVRKQIMLCGKTLLLVSLNLSKE
jgi:hypothetical protein